MGPVGFEPTTSSLSATRSNQLSYEPDSTRRVAGRSRPADKKTTSFELVVSRIAPVVHQFSSRLDFSRRRPFGSSATGTPFAGRPACSGAAERRAYLSRNDSVVNCPNCQIPAHPDRKPSGRHRASILAAWRKKHGLPRPKANENPHQIRVNNSVILFITMNYVILLLSPGPRPSQLGLDVSGLDRQRPLVARPWR